MRTKNFLADKKSIILNVVCTLALAFAVIAANSMCVYIYHDPEKPNELRRLKK